MHRALSCRGCVVEVTSPALIEKVRSATSDENGQYRITNLPVGTYSVTFTLEGFTSQQRNNVVLTTGFTAPVNATMSVGAARGNDHGDGGGARRRRPERASGGDVRGRGHSRAADDAQHPQHPDAHAWPDRHRPGCRLRGRRRRLVQQQHLQPERAYGDQRHRRRLAGARHGGRDDHQHRWRRRHHGDDRRLCRRRRERPGSQRADFRGAGRIGNRRRVDQHHSAHRRQ